MRLTKKLSLTKNFRVTNIRRGENILTHDKKHTADKNRKRDKKCTLDKISKRYKILSLDKIRLR